MQASVTDRPTVPLGLSLVGLTISAVAAVLVGLRGLGMFGAFGYGSMAGMMSSMMGGYYGSTGMMSGYSSTGMAFWGGFAWMWAAFLIVSMGIAGFGVYLMSSSRLNDLRMGSVLVLLGAVLAFPTMFGLVVGSLLMGLGGILGLIWSPTQQTKT